MWGQSQILGADVSQSITCEPLASVTQNACEEERAQAPSLIQDLRVGVGRQTGNLHVKPLSFHFIPISENTGAHLAKHSVVFPLTCILGLSLIDNFINDLTKKKSYVDLALWSCRLSGLILSLI